MIYLLDTDALVTMIRGMKSSRRPKLRQQSESLIQRARRCLDQGDAVGLSAITLSELEFGARRSGRYSQEISAVHKILAPLQIFDYESLSCPFQFGLLRQDLEAKGLVIGAMDTLIAAHALALGATLISNNQQHFARVSGLNTENWLVA